MNTIDDVQGIESIAIIGMSCRFPGAKNIDEFWQNLRNGKESLTFFSDVELSAAGVPQKLYNNPDYVNAGCVIDDIEMFDSTFFGYSDEEAEFIDPQQRLFLECAYEAIEDAGCSIQNYDGTTGIFGGTRTSGYIKVLNSVLMRPGSSRSFEAILGNTVDQACLRISYGLGLKGPSIGVQTVCSTSLVAVHMACESLQSGECDLALAGASAILVPQTHGYLHEDGMFLSPDGHCRAFDIKAQGFVPGNGLGFVVLKRFSEAIEDRNHIYALVKGTAVNNDGSSKIGYRAPSLEGQTAVIKEAMQIADVDAETISYIEANGTGTFHGDSIEIEALSRVFLAQTDKKAFCGIGAVKTNIGHLTQAAGIAGLIKTILSLKNKQLPPSLNCDTPNPKLQDSPFYVIREFSEWKSNGSPRRAGVNAFAIGGTNAHVVLEEAPALPEPTKIDERTFHILTISAKTDNALQNVVNRYDQFMKSHPDIAFQDICFTTNVGRAHYSHRLSVVADSRKKLSEQISTFSARQKQIAGSAQYAGNSMVLKTAFLFSDHTPQFTENYRSFYNTQPQFREAIDLCADILKKHHDPSLFPIIFNDSDLDKNVYTPTAVFALEYALAMMWKSWGIEPSVVTGHGVGEYAAACVAEVFSVEDGLRLVETRDYLGRNVSVKEKNTVFTSFEETANSIVLSSPKINIISLHTGYLTDKKEICRKEYWYQQNQEQLEVIPKSDHLKEQQINCFMEIGPGSLFFDTWQKELLQEQGVWLKTYNKENDNQQQILKCLGKLYVRGADIDWNKFASSSQHRRISLPTYPFERKRCWFDG